MRTLRIKPLDPIMIRDGRPFDETPGVRAYSLGNVPSSVIAGTIRTLLAKISSESSHNLDVFNEEEIAKLARIIVRGPLYEWRGRLFFPMPRDVEIYRTAGDNYKVSYRRPCKVPESQGYLGTGSDGRYEEMWPAALSTEVEGKTASDLPAYISEELMVRWLCDSLQEDEWAKALNHWKKNQEPVHFIAPFARDERTHVAIDSGRGVAKDKALFSTESLVFPEEMSMLAAIEFKGTGEKIWSEHFSAIHSLGGKRRLAHFSAVQNDGMWECPDEVLSSVDGAHYIRMVLATPAYFSKGWLPKWLDGELKTTEDFSENVQLQLLWACVPRWEPVSGWSYSVHERNGKREKAVRRMAPAGSVYFFKVIKGNPQDLVNQKWLASVSDANRRKGAFDDEDGFGLALWGKWNPIERANND